MSKKLTREECDRIRSSINIASMAANPQTCQALLALLNERDSLRKIVNTAKLQLAAGDHFDADLTLELAVRELG